MRKISRHGFGLVVEQLEARCLLNAVLYASDNNATLYSVTTDTGAIRVIGNMGIHMDDLAFAPTGLLYGVDDTSDLYTIDPLTAETHDVGPLGAFVNSLAFSPNGTLYGASDSLYTIETGTGAAHLVSNISNSVSGGDIAFDRSGHLFLTSQLNNLVEVNPSTGATSLIGPLGFQDVWGLGFGSDGQLYGFSHATTQLLSINSATGAATALSSIAGVGGADGADTVPLTLSPQTPVNVQVSQGTYGDHVHVSWSPTAGAQLYDVWRNTTDDLASATQIASGLTDSQYSDTSINKDTTYYYWVNATSPLGTSGFASPVSGFASSNLFTLVADSANGSPAVNTTIAVLDSAGNRLATQTTDNDGSTLWTRLSLGATRFALYGPSGDLWSATSYTIRSGATSAVITQDEPYESNLRVLSGSKDVTGSTAPVKKPLGFVLSVHNPATIRETVRATLSVINSTPNTSFSRKPIAKTIPARGTVEFIYSYTPSTARVFNLAFQIQTSVGRTYTTTDSATGIVGPTITSPVSSRLSISAIDTSNLIHGTVSSLTSSSPTMATLKVDNKLALFMNVDEETIGSATAQAIGLQVGPDLVSPQSTMTYRTTFLHPGDELTVSFSMDMSAGIWNILDVLIGRTAIPSPSALSAVLQDFANLPSLQDAYQELVHPAPGSIAVQSLQLINDLRGLFTDENQAAVLVDGLAKLGLKVTTAELLHVLTVETYYQLAKQLVSLAALHGQLFSGFPIDATFTAAPVRTR